MVLVNGEKNNKFYESPITITNHYLVDGCVENSQVELLLEVPLL